MLETRVVGVEVVGGALGLWIHAIFSRRLPRWIERLKARQGEDQPLDLNHRLVMVRRKWAKREREMERREEEEKRRASPEWAPFSVLSWRPRADAVGQGQRSWSALHGKVKGRRRRGGEKDMNEVDSGVRDEDET
jgi:hypothetical protein